MSTADIVRMKNQATPRRTPKPTRVIPRAPAAERRIIGFGAPPDMTRIKAAASSADPQAGLGATGIIDAIRESANCPVWNMDVIEQVRWNLQGPLATADVNANFGTEIDLFGSGKSVEGIDFVETTMAQPGQTQTYMVTCYIGFHLEPEPLCWTAQGNAWTTPVTPTTTTPISPDVFTQADITNATLGLGAGQSIDAAVLEWGWWANYAAWMMARAYNLRWKIGQQTNIMDEVLRHTAYTPPSAQEGSASNSQVDIINFVNRLNTYYVNKLGSPLVFLKQNFARVGSYQMTAATPADNASVFLPSRAGQIVGATYGGMDLRSMLKGNSEFRKLTLPYLIKPGVPIGLILQQNDNIQGNIMRDYLDAAQGFASLPPLITDAANIGGSSGTASPPVGAEIPLNQTIPIATADLNFNQISNETALFKGGELKISLLIKGFEVTEDWYMAMAADPVIRGVVMNACGIAFAQQGA
jgi:hypothetical protein